MRQVDRRSVLIGASTALAGILGGCTSGVPVPTPGPTSGNRGGDRLEGRIVVSLRRRPTNEAWQALVQAYRQQNPGVEVIWRQPAQGREYADWLRSTLASEDRPDVVTGVPELDPTDPARVGRNELLVDLNRYRGRINPYTQEPWGDDLDFSIARTRGGDRVIDTMGTERVRPLWFYNTDMFDAAGVEPPATWQDLLSACEQLANLGTGVVPFATSYPDVVRRWLAAAYFDQYHPNWVDLVRAQEGDWNYLSRLDGEYEWRPEEPTLHASYTFSPQRFLGALQEQRLSYETSAMAGLAGDLADLLRTHANSDLFEGPDHQEMFLSQQAAIVVADSSLLGRLRLDLTNGEYEEFSWSTFDFPAMTGAGAPSVVRPGETPGGFGASVVAKDSRQVELATDFLMFWFSSAGYQPFVAADGDEFRAQGPPLMGDVQYPGRVASMLEAVDTPGAVSARYGDFWLTGGGDPVLAGALEQLFRRLIEGDLDPVQYARSLQRYFQRRMDSVLSSFRLDRSDLRAPQRRPMAI